MRFNIIFTFVLFLVMSVAVKAQTHWICNPRDYQYDMSMYVDVRVGGVAVDPFTTELAAFVGDECRGVAEAQDIMGNKYYYLRVRSNIPSGENLNFKAYIDGNEIKLFPSKTFTFESSGLLGYPTAPLTLTDNDFTPGDINGDGAITAMDITLLISYYLGQNPTGVVVSAADLNGDGEVTAMDITLLISKYINN